MREIIPDVLMWSWFSEPHGYNFNGHLIIHEDGNLCIDPAEPTAEELAELARRGVARILLTNRNHVRAANMIRARTRARIAIHPADANHARSQGAEVDDELKVGATVGPLSVVAVPGKSPGEVALYWRDRRLLIVGDAIIGTPPGHCRLLREAVMDDPPRLRSSVQRLLNLDFDTLLVGDGEPIVSGAKEQVRQLVATFANQ
jgi:glyoxylase-like metal-dependent hydrolase (beta-lactamase superfamily II)